MHGMLSRHVGSPPRGDHGEERPRRSRGPAPRARPPGTAARPRSGKRRPRTRLRSSTNASVSAYGTPRRRAGLPVRGALATPHVTDQKEVSSQAVRLKDSVVRGRSSRRRRLSPARSRTPRLRRSFRPRAGPPELFPKRVSSPDSAPSGRLPVMLSLCRSALRRIT